MDWHINLKLTSGTRTNNFHFSSSLSSFPLIFNGFWKLKWSTSSTNNTSNFYCPSPSLPIQNASWPFSNELHKQEQILNRSTHELVGCQMQKKIKKYELLLPIPVITHSKCIVTVFRQAPYTKTTSNLPRNNRKFN